MEAYEPRAADIVLSRSGRDAGKHFVVLAVEGEYLLLADGRVRKIEKPKRKKLKHTRYVCGCDKSAVYDKLRSGEKVTNAELRKTLDEIKQAVAAEGGMQVG